MIYTHDKCVAISSITNPMTIAEFINHLVSTFKRINFRDFMTDLCHRFYPDQDLSFMDYFLELSKTENRGQFIVPHDMLFKYGVMIKTDFYDVKKKLIEMRLSESKDFASLNIQIDVETGTSTNRVFMLTPKAFKLILIRADTHKAHDIDVNMYADYCLLQEEIVGYYNDYQVGLEQAVSRVKDCKIDQQIDKIDKQCVKIGKQTKSIKKQTKSIKKQTKMIEAQSKNIDTLMVYAESTNAIVGALGCSQVSAENETLENYFGSTVMLLTDEQGSYS